MAIKVKTGRSHPGGIYEALGNVDVVIKGQSKPEEWPVNLLVKINGMKARLHLDSNISPSTINSRAVLLFSPPAETEILPEMLAKSGELKEGTELRFGEVHFTLAN